MDTKLFLDMVFESIDERLASWNCRLNNGDQCFSRTEYSIRGADDLWAVSEHHTLNYGLTMSAVLSFTTNSRRPIMTRELQPEDIRPDYVQPFTTLRVDPAKRQGRTEDSWVKFLKGHVLCRGYGFRDGDFYYMGSPIDYPFNQDPSEPDFLKQVTDEFLDEHILHPELAYSQRPKKSLFSRLVSA